MDINALLIEAAGLMLTGMVGVFVFLSILITAVTLLSKLAGGSEAQIKTAQPNYVSSPGISNAHIAAISAAIAQYRLKR